MSLNIRIPLIAALTLFAPAALAQNAPPPPPPAGQNAGPCPGGPVKEFGKEDMEKIHERMCTDGYAHEVGALAALEVKLQLVDKQKPLFDRWKAVKLSGAKAHADACAAERPPPPPDKDKTKGKAPSPTEGLKKEAQHLKDRLADIKAELPALEALTATLSDEQIHLLRPPHGGPHDGPHHDGPHDGFGGPGPQDGPGAPPPAE